MVQGGSMKQIIIMRTDLGMRKGKMIAQGAHASLGATLPNQNDPRVKEWLVESFKKICVRADSLEHISELYVQAARAGLITCLITDSGLTEFAGEPTVTCLAIGPDTDENLDPVTGHLRLL